MDAERALFLTFAFATHGVVGYALVGRFTDVDPRIGFVLALMPDVDFLFPVAWGVPFVHRGITHTLVFASAVVAMAYLSQSQTRVALASGLALGSHLLIDSLSPMGVPLLFPLSSIESTVSGDLPVHGFVGTLVLWTLALGVLIRPTNVLGRRR